MRVSMFSASNEEKLQNKINEKMKHLKESVIELDPKIDLEIISCLTQCVPVETQIIKNIGGRHETHQVIKFKWVATLCWDTVNTAKYESA